MGFIKRQDTQDVVDCAIIGGGPIGLACALELIRRGLRPLIFEKGAVADVVRRFPLNMTFFSTSELIELTDLPLVSHGPRPTRLEALKYYNRVADTQRLDVRRHTCVESIRASGGSFIVSSDREGPITARTVIIATGYYDQPNLIGVPGENLPHVSHYFDEGVRYSHMNVLVVGGQNSACDTALDLYRSGARVIMVHRGAGLGRSVKYWIRPDVENRIKNNEIDARFAHEVVEIRERETVIRHLGDGAVSSVKADFVFLMTGYHPDVALLRGAGVSVDDESLIPTFHPQTFESNVPGLYVAGSITAGKRTSEIFIENGRVHAAVIAEQISNRATTLPA